MSEIRIQSDLYCPLHLAPIEEMTLMGETLLYTCSRPLHGQFSWPSGSTPEGLFTWLWDEQHPKPNPGCPVCGTCNIAPGNGWRPSAVEEVDFYYWHCERYACRATWWGFWSQYPDGRMRWTIRIPVADVPFAGTPPNSPVHWDDEVGEPCV